MKHALPLLLAALLALLLLAPAPVAGGDAQVYGPNDPITMFLLGSPGGNEFVARNSAPCAFTVKLWFTELANMAASAPLPVVAVVPAGSALSLVAIHAVDTGRASSFYFMYRWKPGAPDALHDENAVYDLPFARGRAWRVLQGYDGAYTHNGDYRFSLDFDMPEGSEVCAARGGLVVEAQDSLDGHGLEESFRGRDNYVRVLHDDGTVAEYVHLMQGGARVAPGQRVRAGELLGLSGNVGYSAGPHLHFDVYVAVDGEHVRTIPTRFRTDSCGACVPELDVFYRRP